LLAVELVNQMGATAGIQLRATLLFDYPTIHDMAGYLLRDVLELEIPDEPAPESSTSPLSVAEETEAMIESLETMSDEQVDRFFRE
jgi:hypothetical protein